MDSSHECTTNERKYDLYNGGTNTSLESNEPWAQRLQFSHVIKS